jgi:dTDP-4-amino-4,6-dideoxygalactose transaminase
VAIQTGIPTFARTSLARPRSTERQEIPGIKPCFEMDHAAMEAIARALDSGQVTNNGPQVRAFETALAKFLGVPETAAISNGSEALMLSLKAMRLETGAVILPAYTYIATLNAVMQCGFEPVFCDIVSGSFTMDPRHLAELIHKNPDVRCVIPVNAFGAPPDLRAIRAECDGAGLKLLYDNAHGFGVETNTQRYAVEADAQIFSFHATKTLPAVEGGLVIANDAALISEVKRLRNHGLGASVGESGAGFNAKMDELRAIIGMNSLRTFPEALARRRSYGFRMMKSFQQFPEIYRVQEIPRGVETNFQNVGVRCSPASKLGLKAVMDLFKARGIGVRSYFDPPLYNIPGFEGGGALPVTELVWQTLISFPIHSRMSEAVLEQIDESIEEVASILRAQ